MKIIILDNLIITTKNAKIGESVLPGLGGEEGDVDGVDASVLFLQDVFVDLIVCLWFWCFHVFFSFLKLAFVSEQI